MVTYFLFKSQLQQAEVHLNNGVTIIRTHEAIIHERDLAELVKTHNKLSARQLSYTDTVLSLSTMFMGMFRVPVHVTQCQEFEIQAHRVSRFAMTDAIEAPDNEKSGQIDVDLQTGPGETGAANLPRQPSNSTMQSDYSNPGSTNSVRGWRTDGGITIFQSPSTQALLEVLRQQGVNVNLRISSVLPASEHAQDGQDAESFMTHFTRIASTTGSNSSSDDVLIAVQPHSSLSSSDSVPMQ
ncbi:hypothetical protein JAAARDRAFT_77939 [Jaapia argillacea MUCL 33604]|uniref:Uncharacterized protein n=1 Tax=Jaapia argillacea MUCL 33604 TaxID=933084 RepID=A0A067PYS5_9AGAM|nr:hypothetical protein JAAARDRAFT_77939 [Jaapia argillacea MUCL 33604]